MSLYSLNISITCLNCLILMHSFLSVCVCQKCSTQVLIEKCLRKQKLKVTLQVFLDGTTLM